MNKTETQIRDLLDSQHLAVLSTLNGQFKHPYTSIVGFSHSADLRYLFFATPKTTRKYQNLTTCNKVALLIDNRKNDGTDIGAAAAVTVLGEAAETGKTDNMVHSFLEKHPQLDAFVQAPTTALFQVTVSNYILVNRFQDVSELRMG